MTKRTSVEVPRPTWDAATVGGRVCVVLHPGALGVRWYVVRACRDDER